VKTRNWLSGILAAALLAETSCGQAQKAPQPTMINGVKVDLARFHQAFATASPELQRSVSKVNLSIRYGQYAVAVAELGKIVNMTDLTEPQKKVASEVLEQLKQVAGQVRAKPAQS
jgi:hypothetical protein